jgi:hypothetical protein
MTAPLAPISGLTDAQLGEALARALARLSEKPVDRGDRAQWCNGHVPNFSDLAAWYHVNARDLVEVFDQETGGGFINTTGRLQ